MKYRLAFSIVLLAWTTASAGDWSHWRGPEQNGVARDRDLPEKWSPDPKKADNNLVWRAPYGGRSTPIVQNGRLYLINKVGEGLSEQERVMAFDAKDGTMLKEHKFNIFLTDIVSDRIGWANLVGDPATGNVYAHGTQGLFFCFDKDLNVKWQHSLTEEYGRISGYGGRVTSPIVDGDLVIMGIINASWGDQGMGRNRFVAFEKNSGKIVWWASTGFPVKDTYSSTPVVAVIGGQRLLVSGGGDGGVHAFKVRTGEKVWSHVFGSGAVNCSPVVQGDRVYIGHGEENDNSQGRMICLDGAKVKEGKPSVVWQVDGIKVKYASPIIDKDKLYICDEIGTLYCLNPDDGKRLWKYSYGKNTKGSGVLADGKIYIGEVDSKFHILQPGADECKELHSQLFRRPAGEAAPIELNGSPAVADGKIFFMTSRDLFCIGKKGEAKADKIPTLAVEGPLPENAKPAFLQIYPADVALHPEDTLNLSAWAYDAQGRLIGKVAVDGWGLAPMRPPEGLPPPKPSLTPPPAPPVLQATLSEKAGKETTLTPNKVPLNQFGRVTAKLGNLHADCRVRVAARLPFAADFSKVPTGRTPGGWVNCQGKFAVVELKDGKKVLQKLALNASPLVARANAYITLPTFTDYTIACDVMGQKLRDDMPDVGIVANRYTLQLAGNTQSLRLTSWDAIPRVDKTIAFGWKPEVWYRMKLTVDVQGDKAVIRGKVWQRDASEPADWTVEFTDTTPNKEGAPAIYGFATGILEGHPGAAIFYDNLKIAPNKNDEKK